MKVPNLEAFTLMKFQAVTIPESNMTQFHVDTCLVGGAKTLFLVKLVNTGLPRFSEGSLGFFRAPEGFSEFLRISEDS